ncbi:FAM81B isoform 2, partial [Pan troglodytes]
VMQLLGKIETASSEQTSNLKMVQGDYRHEMNLLEFKKSLKIKWKKNCCSFQAK